MFEPFIIDQRGKWRRRVVNKKVSNLTKVDQEIDLKGPNICLGYRFGNVPSAD